MLQKVLICRLKQPVYYLMRKKHWHRLGGSIARGSNASSLLINIVLPKLRRGTAFVLSKYPVKGRDALETGLVGHLRDR